MFEEESANDLIAALGVRVRLVPDLDEFAVWVPTRRLLILDDTATLTDALAYLSEVVGLGADA